MRRPRTWPVFVLVPLALGLLHCGTSSGPAADVIYQGTATDEVYGVMVDDMALLMSDDSKAAAVTSPTEGEVLPGAVWPHFQWTPGLASRGRFHAHPRGSSARAWLGEGTAEAHEPPITATVHMLTFTVPGAAKPIVVLTTDLAYTPDDAAWATLKAATGPIQLEIISVHVTQNVIDWGPYRATTPRHFTIH